MDLCLWTMKRELYLVSHLPPVFSWAHGEGSWWRTIGWSQSKIVPGFLNFHLCHLLVFKNKVMFKLVFFTFFLCWPLTLVLSSCVPSFFRRILILLNLLRPSPQFSDRLECYDFVIFWCFVVAVRVEVMFFCGFIYHKLNQNLYWSIAYVQYYLY